MATRLFSRATPFGHLVGVALPGGDDAAALAALADELPAEERAHALTLSPARRATWAGGRIALRAALFEVGAPTDGIAAIRATDRGAPLLPAGFSGSISHKATLAVALAAPFDDGATLGIDVELPRASRVDISSHVLTAAERTALDLLPHAARARELLCAFAAKEAIYKALDPWVRRYVAFQEVELARVADGARVATARLKDGEGTFSIEVHEEPAEGLILMTARVRGVSP